MEKMKAKVLEEIKPFTRGQDMSEFYETPQVIDGSETTDETEVIDYHFELSKDIANLRNPMDMMAVFMEI